MPHEPIIKEEEQDFSVHTEQGFRNKDFLISEI